LGQPRWIEESLPVVRPRRSGIFDHLPAGITEEAQALSLFARFA
jgi:hypothetical protein